MKKEQRLKDNLLFFYLTFGCPTTNFGPSLRGNCNRANVNHCIYSSFDPKVTDGLVTRLGLKTRPSALRGLIQKSSKFFATP